MYPLWVIPAISELSPLHRQNKALAFVASTGVFNEMVSPFFYSYNNCILAQHIPETSTIEYL